MADTMTGINAKDVAELRRRTGAGMMECKKALAESGGDFDKATEWLRAHGVARADKRADRAAKEGVVEAYVHHAGNIGVLLELNCETDFVARTDDFRLLAKDVAMHIAATAPQAVSVDQLDPAAIERERRIFTEQVAQEGKPEAVRAKIVEGKLKKFYSEVVLLEQPFVKDDKKSVGQFLRGHGPDLTVKRFVRLEIGES